MTERPFFGQLERLSRKYGGKVLFGRPMSLYSTMRVGGKAAAVYLPSCAEELIQLSDILRRGNIRSEILGRGSNVLFPDNEFNAVVVIIREGVFSEISARGQHLVLGAGVRLEYMIAACRAEGLGGAEGLVGIPATVGGAVRTNAGYKRDIGSMVRKVLVWSETRGERWLEQKEMGFGYRCSGLEKGDIVLKAEFEFERCSRKETDERLKAYFSEKMEKQPLLERTLGCIFKNPQGDNRSAGELIELSGMKGSRSGGAVVSEKHANFIVNEGSATASDVKKLMKKIENEVKNRFSVELYPEIMIMKDAEYEK
ncbi:MAG: UDP-N-acetylmuramate dehydrogenase [Candidatus Omnitrophota bacterium]|nr:UDP-N-acetylmuramate dehydrogenase [Candidatus Omnitrophota bacterium]